MINTVGTYITKSGSPAPSEAVFLCLSFAHATITARRRAGNKIPFGGIPDWASFGPVGESRHQLYTWWHPTNQKEADMPNHTQVAPATNVVQFPYNAKRLLDQAAIIRSNNPIDPDHYDITDALTNIIDIALNGFDYQSHPESHIALALRSLAVVTYDLQNRGV